MYLTQDVVKDTIALINNLWNTCFYFSNRLDDLTKNTWWEKAASSEEAEEYISHIRQDLLSEVGSIEDWLVELGDLYQNADELFSYEYFEHLKRLLNEIKEDLIKLSKVNGSNISLSLDSKRFEFQVFLYEFIRILSQVLQKSIPLVSVSSPIDPNFIAKKPQAILQELFARLEDRLRKRIKVGVDLYGESLINKAFGGDRPILVYSQSRAEQQGLRNLFAGAYSAFRNPRMHRIVEENELIVAGVFAIIELLNLFIDETEYNATSES